jgi:hypothetical protein
VEENQDLDYAPIVVDFVTELETVTLKVSLFLFKLLVAVVSDSVCDSVLVFLVIDKLFQN